MKKIYFLAVLLLEITFSAYPQGNVGIGTNTPSSSAKLDIDVSSDATKSGLLIPRVALTSTTDATTIPTPATSLLVFNTATAGSAPNNVTPGYYYNAGTSASPNWVRMITKADNGWTVANTANTPAGKTDNQYVTGNVGIGDFSASSPLQTLDVQGRINIANGVIQKGGTAITGTSDLGLYSRVNGSWMRYVTNAASHVWFTDDGIGTTTKMHLNNAGYLQLPTTLNGTGNRPVFADATGVLNVNGKLRYTSIHDCFVGTYVSCSNCDKFVWFSKPGGYEADDNADSPTSRKNMWMAPYSGRIVAIYLGVGPNSSNGGDEISKGRFIFRKGSTLSEAGTPYYTNMTNSGSASYTNTSNWQGGYFTTLAGSPTYTLTSPNRGRFSLNENQSLAWYDNNSSVFTFTKGDILAIGVSGEYIEDNSYYMTVIWEYNVDDY